MALPQTFRRLIMEMILTTIKIITSCGESRFEGKINKKRPLSRPFKIERLTVCSKFLSVFSILSLRIINIAKEENNNIAAFNRH